MRCGRQRQDVATPTVNALLLMMGGAGERFGGNQPKQFLHVDHDGLKKPLFEITAEKLLASLPIHVLVLVLPKDYAGGELVEPVIQRLSTRFEGLHVTSVAGGNTRFRSFMSGLKAARSHAGIERLLVHDANRPYLSSAFLSRVAFQVGRLSGDVPAMIPVAPVVDSIVRLRGVDVIAYENRAELHRVQTPQLLHFQTFCAAYDKLLSGGSHAEDFTDEGSFCLSLGLKVASFEGDAENTKITFMADLVSENL